MIDLPLSSSALEPGSRGLCLCLENKMDGHTVNVGDVKHGFIILH